MVNRNLRVCARCYDQPQEQLRAIILPPDPMPARGVRIEPYDVDERNEYTLKAPIGKGSMFGATSSMDVAEPVFYVGLPASLDGVSDLTAGMHADFRIPASLDGVSDLTAGIHADFRIPASLDGVSDLTAVLTQVVSAVIREATDSYTHSGASPSTEVGAAIGSATSDRLVFVSISGIKSTDNPITSVTIAGISATAASQVRRAVTGAFIFSEIWWVAVPTGTTATIVITASSDASLVLGTQVYKITGADTTTPIANSDTGSVASGNVTTDVTIGNNEASIATAMTGLSTASETTTFANITEDSEFSLSFGVFANGGSASRQDTSAPGAITFTASVSSDNFGTNKVMAAVVITIP